VDYVKNQASAEKATDDRHAWAEPGVEDLGDGLYRIPLPLPGDALTAVNVYAMVGDDGVDLIDSGMAITQARDRLTEALGQLGFGLPDVRNFFITHIHQDHYTLAVELRTTLKGQIVLGEAERENLAAIQAVSAGRAQIGFVGMLDAMGAPDLAKQVRELLGSRRVADRPQLQYSDPDSWLPDGALIDLPSRTLRAIHTPGHTTGHVVFHDESAGLLFAGDHVLPHITPSIGFQPVITRASLIQYLSSLRLMLTLPDTKLLPAHGPVKPSTHARVHELLEHHETRLAQTMDAATGGPITAFEAATALPWTRRQRKLSDLDPMNQLLATGETAAHLEVLVADGKLTRSTAEDGVDRYTFTAGPAATSFP
jgi:glyoxylase-like metal-dependent hydrolase (beta-lactamase superfamily II)